MSAENARKRAFASTNKPGASTASGPSEGGLSTHARYAMANPSTNHMTRMIGPAPVPAPAGASVKTPKREPTPETRAMLRRMKGKIATNGAGNNNTGQLSNLYGNITEFENELRENTVNTLSIANIKQKRGEGNASEKMYIQGTTGDSKPVYKVIKTGDIITFRKLEDGNKWGEPINEPEGESFKIIQCPKPQSMSGGVRKSRRQRKQKRRVTHRKQRKQRK
jgi:hypothetical protein